jgi:hypothetical protein
MKSRNENYSLKLKGHITYFEHIFLGGKGWPARKADNLTATCEPTV